MQIDLYQYMFRDFAMTVPVQGNSQQIVNSGLAETTCVSVDLLIPNKKEKLWHGGIALFVKHFQLFSGDSWKAIA